MVSSAHLVGMGCVNNALEETVGAIFRDKVSSVNKCSCYRDWWEAALKRLVAGFSPRRPGFKPGSSHVGLVVDKVALGQGFSEYFGFPCQSSFHQFLQNRPHLPSGAGTIGQ
jgi:hypothetical protein